MINGHIQEYPISNVKENLLYMFGMDRALDYLGASDAE